jgi:predicted transcriptional regulator
MSLAVAIHCTSGLIYRNVRPVETITEELDASSVEYVQIPASEKKIGSWEVVLVFQDKESLEQYEKGELKAPWDIEVEEAPKSINPLKASKRAARGGR